MIDVQRLIDSTMMRGVSIWKEYEGIPGFSVNVAYVSKQHMLQILDTCTQRVWNKESRQFEDKLDREKVAKHWAEKVVLGWRGLTLGKFQKLFPIEVPEDQKEQEVTSDIANRVALLWNSGDFENWCLAVATSPDYFVGQKKQAETDLKNLG